MHLCLVVVGALYILFYDYDYEIRRDIEKYYTHLFTILMSVVYCLHIRSRISSRCQSHSCSTAAHLAKFGCPNIIPGWRMLGPKNLGTLRTVAGPCSTVKHASSLKELLCKINGVGRRYDSQTFGSGAANGASMWASRALTFKTTQGHLYPWGTCILMTIMIHSNHGSISYVNSFRGKRRHRSKKQCFPTPGVVPLLTEI